MKNKNFSQNQISGLGPIEPNIYDATLKRFKNGQEITLINIICPGYKKRREAGVEEFDFVQLSEEILECPNVVLMIEKMNRFTKYLKKHMKKNVRVKTILADVAILNYKEMAKKQKITKVMDNFLISIKNSGLVETEITELLKMSRLKYEFRKIPLGGIKPKVARLLFEKVKKDIRLRAEEYIGSLVFGRVNKYMSDGKTIKKTEILKQSQREVERFVAEYGLAGLAIKKLYKNPIVCFTEPSGYLRGYFYNSFLESKNRLPVIYLC